jgi:Mn2+/Fe2+ NRAMP family transporter
MAARLGLVTGTGLGTLIRNRFPRTIVIGAVILVAVANTFNIAADLQAMGAATNLVIPVNRSVLTIGFAIAMVVLEIAMPYHRYSKILRWLALSLGAYVLVLFMVNVDWVTVLKHTLIPTMTGTRAELVALIAVFGTTVSPYLFFWQASEEVEEETERHELPAVEAHHLAAMRVDVVGGMGSAVFVAFAIIVAAALTLHPAGVTNIETAAQAAAALQPIAGRWAGTVFALGIIGLGLLAVPVLAGSTAYAVSEAFGWNEGLSKRFRDARSFYVIIMASSLIGVALGFGGLDPIRSLYYAAILNGVTAPPLIILMIMLARSKTLMGTHRSGRLSIAICAIAACVAIALAVAIAVMTFTA